MLSRKPPTSATTISSRPEPRLPVPAVRRRIWEAACDLVVCREQRKISVVLANRFNTGERIIEQVLILEGMRHERCAAALKVGARNLLDTAREVESSAFRDAQVA